jgi:hypothetical protein
MLTANPGGPFRENAKDLETRRGEEGELSREKKFPVSWLAFGKATSSHWERLCCPSQRFISVGGIAELSGIFFEDGPRRMDG